jgi:predicted nucleic acid-binding protein
MLLIDSSAIVRFFSKEPGWEEVVEHISEAVALSLAMVEVSNALLKKAAKKEIGLDLVSKLVGEYSTTVRLLDQNRYMDTALRIAAANGISIYDSTFIACALMEGYTLVSCDEKQVKIAKSLGVNAIGCFGSPTA